MRLVVTMAALLALGGCSKPSIKCDANGLIITPANASDDEKATYTTRNLELAARRLNDATGNKHADYNRASLDKAEGCP
jgi:hypothetical protein